MYDIDGVMIYLYCFPLSIKQKSLKSIFLNFSLEKENDGCLSFLYINIFRAKWKFVTNVYRKKNFSGVNTNFNSFTPETYKTGLIESVIPILQFVYGFREIPSWNKNIEKYLV